MDTTFFSPVYTSRPSSFNGAMTSQPWIRSSCSRPQCPRTHSFNGAMTSQPWIRFWCLSLPLSMSSDGRTSPGAYRAVEGVTDGLQEAGLQWSHDLSAMDTTFFSPVYTSRPSSFNGAMTSQPWIRSSCSRPQCPRTQTFFSPVYTSRPSSFNGAMTSQPWIRFWCLSLPLSMSCRPGRVGTVHGGPSMEP
jgi:hypothetical protein